MDSTGFIALLGILVVWGASLYAERIEALFYARGTICPIRVVFFGYVGRHVWAPYALLAFTAKYRLCRGIYRGLTSIYCYIYLINFSHTLISFLGIYLHHAFYSRSGTKKNTRGRRRRD